jgi:CheY-like chemotaxis protein
MKQILICDDEPHMVEGLRFLLRGSDRRILVATNGKQALEHIRGNIPDLLITDVMMPEMNGLELVAALRGNEATKNLPIIILTAKGQLQYASVAQDVWNVTVIGKPFEPRCLKELVSARLGGELCPACASK